ncbi:MAG: methyltransferase family protein [Candidatus Acidiferrales bacterium]
MRAKAVMAIQLAVASALCVYAGFLCSQYGWPEMRTIEFALVLFGYLFWAAARIQLGSSFAVKARAKELVTRGVYSKIRNPIYVFGTVLIAGLFLVIGRLILLLLLLVIIPTQIVRAKKEAEVLEEKFGDSYRAYRATTWF